MTVVHWSDGNISVSGWLLLETCRKCRVCFGNKQKFTALHSRGRWNENTLFVKVWGGVGGGQLMRHFESVLSGSSNSSSSGMQGSDMVTSEWR